MFWTGAMNALEELTEDRIDRAHVDRRVNDWENRIEGLYADLKAWLPLGWAAADDGSVPMHEELMRRFAVPERRLPVLSLEKDGTKQGRVEPRGLWIVGNNGRIDLILSDRHYLIIDRAESFEPPDWQVASILARRDQKPLSRQILLDILA